MAASMAVLTLICTSAKWVSACAHCKLLTPHLHSARSIKMLQDQQLSLRRSLNDSRQAGVVSFFFLGFLGFWAI
jgi:hypothetical protein